MSGSTIPTALTALAALFKSVAPSGCPVIDGPAYDPPPDFLAVGWDRTDAAGVSGSVDIGDYGRSKDRETYDVSCLLSYSYDSNEVTTVRTALFAALDLFDAALDQNPTVSGSVMQAAISEYELTPIHTGAGTLADLRFTVHVEAFK